MEATHKAFQELNEGEQDPPLLTASHAVNLLENLAM
jgi:hypothetical protein